MPRDGAETIDAAGCTLIPGLVEGHAHPSFSNAATTVEIGDIPPEEHVLVTMHNARAMLDAGFTSLYGAASAKVRLDVVIRNEIEAGRIAGPRLRAASPEITVTGGLGYVPITVHALPRPDGWVLESEGADGWVPVPMEVEGGDGWQASDAGDGLYSLTYTVPNRETQRYRLVRRSER